jgi:DNA invertase Pin-like site-specific DNA recombinase
LEACLKILREGDTLVGLVAQFEQRKINFESLTEKIETVSAARRLIFHVFAALAGVRAQPDPRTDGSRSQGGARPRSQRRSPCQTLLQRDKDRPSPAQNG